MNADEKRMEDFLDSYYKLTGAGVVFCIIALCLGVTFSQFEKAYPNGIGIMRKNYVSFDDDWDDDDELDDTEMLYRKRHFPVWRI